MVRMLKEELSDKEIEASYNACKDVKLVSPEVNRIVCAIDALCDMVGDDLVQNAKNMEKGFKDQCDEIKK